MTAVDVGAVVVVGAGVLEEEEEARCTFQKLEEEELVVGSVLTTSQVFSDVEALDASRVSQVARRFVAGFSDSTFSAAKKGFCSIVGLSLTVARRVTVGFFLSVGCVASGSSWTSCLSRPTIHHRPEDFLWTLIDSVFLSSMSPIRRAKSISMTPNRYEKRGGGGGEQKG